MDYLPTIHKDYRSFVRVSPNLFSDKKDLSNVKVVNNVGWKKWLEG